MKIAVSNNPINKLFFQNIDINSEMEHQIFNVNELEALDLLLNERVDVALISPISYAKGSKINDLRIIPTTCVFATGYTELYSMYFHEGMDSVEKCGKSENDIYLSEIFRILLAENYDLSVSFENSSEELINQIKNFGTASAFGKDKNILNALDLSDDWFITYENPLPISLWVCKNKDNDIDKVKLDNLITLKTEELPIRDLRNLNDEREGKISFKWESEYEKSLEHLLDLLFYHQIIVDMADIKFINEYFDED